MTIFPSPSERGSLQDLRKRGGQPGNRNALKHGFYSGRYREIEDSELQTVLSQGLEDEIGLLRVVMRRVFEYANKTEKPEAESWISTLSALGVASTRLAGLLKTQKILGGDGNEIAKTLAQALAEVNREIRPGR